MAVRATTDVITDFDILSTPIRRDVIDLSDLSSITDFADLVANHLTSSGGNAVISDGNTTITLNNIDINSLSTSDFIF